MTTATLKDAEVATETQARTPTQDGQQPAWVTNELPPEYAKLAERITKLRLEADQYERIAAVVWQTGLPLVTAVRDLFAALQFETTLSDSHENYDLKVDLGAEGRLLIQVYGGSTGLDRKTPLMTKVLRTLQEDAGDKDRVVVVANTHCDTPLAERNQEPATADALRIIQGLGANVISTSTLFGVWRYSLKNLADAKESIVSLYRQDGGMFR